MLTKVKLRILEIMDIFLIVNSSLKQLNAKKERLHFVSYRGLARPNKSTKRDAQSGALRRVLLLVMKVLISVAHKALYQSETGYVKTKKTLFFFK